LFGLLLIACLCVDRADIMGYWRKVVARNLLKQMNLNNGLMLVITDESSNYYADFWNLKVVIKGMAHVAPDHLLAICPSDPSEEKAKEALGAEITYHRELTRIGVREAEKDATVQKLLVACEENSLPYLRYPCFPERMVRSQWKKLAEEIKGRDSQSDE
jgi:hypothetical protein